MHLHTVHALFSPCSCFLPMSPKINQRKTNGKSQQKQDPTQGESKMCQKRTKCKMMRKTKKKLKIKENDEEKIYIEQTEFGTPTN